MSDVKTIDINGEQWNMKDQDARSSIVAIKDSISTKDLPDAWVAMRDGYTCKSIRISECYKAGKVVFACVRIENLSGKDIGSSHDVIIASTNLLPIKFTSFIARDYKAPATVRCHLDRYGDLGIGESNGIKDGNNVIIGELIFAER